MIKEALQYLVGLKDNKTYTIDGRTYSDNPLHLIEQETYRRRGIEFGSLDAIVKMIIAEIGDYTDGTEPIFIHVKDHRNVDVFTRPDKKETRKWPYSARCNDADFSEGWRGQDSAIIELRSRFIPTEDSDYLISLISRISNDQGVKSEDNGVSQTVVVRKGISLAENELVKPRITLKPFRTFREVAQPESEFVLRVDESRGIGLFEADGGMWKMEAKDSIKAYFEKELREYVDYGSVIVMV